MRVINLGLRAKQQTTLMVTMPAADSTAVLRIGRDDKFAIVAFQGTSASVPLSAGDYIITLDSALRPAPNAPFTLSTDVDAIYMSAGTPQNGVRPLVAGSGVQVNEVDPKDPWPPLAPTGTSEESSFLTSSSIIPSMKALLDTFEGKGAGDKTAPPPAIHALLIGIDAYVQGTGRDGAIYRPLRGCVRDILEVEQFLHDVGVPAERITTRGTAGVLRPCFPPSRAMVSTSRSRLATSTSP